jgi:hypothetical protein
MKQLQELRLQEKPYSFQSKAAQDYRTIQAALYLLETQKQ